MTSPERYTHGHHESVLKAHTWRTIENSAAYLVPSLSAQAALFTEPNLSFIVGDA